MQKILTILFTSMFLSFGVFAQQPACIPGQISQDTSIILPEPFNSSDLTGGIDSTCVGLFYEQVFTALVPESFPFGGQNFSVDSLALDLEGAIDGLPNGLDYACNPPNCVFLPDSAGCFVISGTTDASVTPGDFEIDINLNAFNSLLPMSIGISYPDDLGDDDLAYIINVSGSDTCGISTATSVLKQNLLSTISPNPTSDFAELKIDADQAFDLQLTIMDLLGRVHTQRKVTIDAGQNTIPLQLQNMVQGIYFVNLTNGKEFISHKMVIER